MVRLRAVLATLDSEALQGALTAAPTSPVRFHLTMQAKARQAGELVEQICKEDAGKGIEPQRPLTATKKVE